MSNTNRTCLTLEQLIGSKSHSLSKNVQKELNLHLQECAFCSDAFDGLSGVKDFKETRATVNFLKKGIPAQTLNNKSNYRKKYFLQTAAIVFSILAILFFMNAKSPNQLIFEKYFEPYPNTIPLARGTENIGNLEWAMVEYEHKNYFEAIEFLNIILKKDPNHLKAHFYTGISKLAVKNTNEAIIHFESILAASNTSHKNEVTWFLALAYIKSGNIEQAKELLQDFVILKNKYYIKSKILIKELNTFN